MTELDDGDLDLDEMSDSEEWYYFAVDDEGNKHPKRGSSSMDTDDESGKVEEHIVPPSIRELESMEIKDAVKENVLPFLPAKTLIRFRSVSKQWDHWIRSPFLAHQQSYTFNDISGFFCQHGDKNPTFLSLNHSSYGVPTPALSFLHDRVVVRASSHGLLICQARYEGNSYFICNPATQDWKQLPKPHFYHTPNSAHVLAFEPSMLNMEAHYQLICAVPLFDQPIICFEIYSSETRSWRCSESMCVELGDFSFIGTGFYMNGVAYWKTSDEKILAFDLKTEVYGFIPLSVGSSSCGILTENREELCYITISHTENRNCVVRMYCGLDMTQRQSINLQLEAESIGDRGYNVLPYFEGDELMILVGGFIYSYRLSDGTTRVVGTSGGVEYPAKTKFLPYVNSLVSLV